MHFIFGQASMSRHFRTRCRLVKEGDFICTLRLVINHKAFNRISPVDK